MIGQNVQNYTITSYLGEGGMGTVYKASDIMLGREVALKMLHATLISQPQFLERFKKEARVLAQLLHPNIAVIYNFIGQDNNHFMVMEYVEGSNLDSLLRKYKQLPYSLVVPIFLQVLEGLNHAHKKGIFHRDIKPSNLILTPDGTVKLMDFGIAKIAGEQRLTQVNKVVGTIEYMPPELIEGKDPSIASDIYAAGVTMYEMLTGKLPFESNTDYSLMQEILKKKPISVDKLNMALPQALSRIVMKALEKKPENRFTDAKAFQQALALAFPQFREIDMAQAEKQVFPDTQNVYITKQKKEKLKTPAFPIGKDVWRKSFVLFQSIQQNVLTKQKVPVIIGIFSLLLAAVISINMLTKENQTTSNENNMASISNEITLPPEEKEAERINSPITTTANPSYENTTPAIINDPTLKKEERKVEARDEKKNDAKKTEPMTKELKKQTENLIPVQKEEKKEDPPVITLPEKKEENLKPSETSLKNQTLKLNSRIEVNLYLREAINESTAHTGQSLIFSVSRPVLYNGQTIIDIGASATGRIRNLSKKKIIIVLNSVTGSQGQALPFENIELSGRIDEIISSRNYTGTLKKGTLINF